MRGKRTWCERNRLLKLFVLSPFAVAAASFVEGMRVNQQTLETLRRLQLHQTRKKPPSAALHSAVETLVTAVYVSAAPRPLRHSKELKTLHRVDHVAV